MTPTDLANLATLTEAAEILNARRSTLLSAAKRGAFETKARRPRFLVDLADVEAWLLSRTRSRHGRPPLALDYDDAASIARDRGISEASARRAIQRRNKKAA